MKGIDDLDDPQGLSTSRIRMPGTSSERATPGWYKLQSKNPSDKKLKGALRAWTHTSFR